MKTRVAFDVSGLAWRYRTGVQNLYWAYIDAWKRQSELHDRFDITFYDRSGHFNHSIAEAVGDAYVASAPRWWPASLRRPLQAAVRGAGLFNPSIDGCVNHVWNWGIFHANGAPASITVPDILPIEHPEWFDARFRRLTEESVRFARQHAQFVFTISHDVKHRLCEATGLPLERVRVVYPGIDLAYFSPVNDETAERVLRKYGVQSGRYVISSGFLDPRKNLPRQLEAFGRATSNGLSDLKYALTGLRTAMSDEVMRIVESPAMRSKVVFLGYVPKDDLISLTSRSAGVLYCSLAEGFGLPIVEAMALGAPVVTSATTSMREIAESRAELVDPTDVDDIARAIEATIRQEPARRLARARENRIYAERFTIENWLGGHLDAFSGQTERERWK